MAVPLEQFVKLLEDSGILAGDTLQEFIPPRASPKDAEELARELVRQKKLTKFQAEEVSKGKGKSLTLGNYVLMEKIGEGGMGQVFKARHRRMDRMVAIKVLPKAVMNDRSAITRFEREVKAAARISHPNIVTAHDADQSHGVHFLVMEFVEGSDLSALVKKSGPLSVDGVVNYVLQAARGLEAAHKHGIVHRDIKPANLLLDGEGTIKILDMGLARLSADGDVEKQAELTGAGVLMGTVDYMAPEQAVNPKTADGRADTYSLGCSLFYLLTGKAIYGGDTLPAKIMAHQNELIPSIRAIRSEVPEQIEAVFRKMVAKKVADRYQNMSEVIADLEHCGAGEAPPLKTPLTSGIRPGSGLGTANLASQATLAPRSPVGAGEVLSDKVVPRADGVGQATTGLRTTTELVAAGRQSDAITPTEVAQQQRRSQKLLDEQNYDAVIPMLVKLAELEGTLFRDTAAWAKSELPAVEQKQQKLRERVATACVKAHKLLETYNYGEVAQMLEAIPTGARTDEVRQLLTLAGERFEDCLGLQQEIDTAVRGKNYERLLPLVKRFLKLKPDNAKMRRLADNLARNRPDRAIRKYKETGKYFDVAGRLVEPKEIAGGVVFILAIFAGMTFAVNSYLAGSRETGSAVPPDATTSQADVQPNQPAASRAEPPVAAGNQATHETERSEKPTPAKATTDINSPAFQQWMKDVAALPAQEQVDAVAKRLQELNPGFDGKLKPGIQNGVVTQLFFVTVNVADISPVRALGRLRFLDCHSYPQDKGKLVDLTPLKGMPLTALQIPYTQVTDLSPLEGMKLQTLICVGTNVTDLSPLKDLPLVALNCGGPQLSDLSPLKGMSLRSLVCHSSSVTDLSPLIGMPLTYLHVTRSPVADLSPLKDLPLKDLKIDFKPDRDTDILRSIKTLEKINDKPAAEFWKEVEEQEKGKKS